ncbi:MAG: diaminopimelate decarboxylase [Bacteroidaceae bacterium]|nr:diaminopimelate decarboxylase [Bacteroidaceae bacterium]
MELQKYIERFKVTETPFYFYDIDLLKETFSEASAQISTIPNSTLHFAVKANDNATILRYANEYGFGIDAVSGGEILKAVEAGIPGNRIVFAGVGKTDREILIGIDHDIMCFNAESVPEIDIINKLAAQRNKTARIALRINPNVDAHTHKNITTGLEENKFGIALDDMVDVIRRIQALPHVSYHGLHFHIGSQVLEFDCFVQLCHKINEIQDRLEALGIQTQSINVGGGLGVDYEDPMGHPVADFKGYFQTFREHLRLRPGQSFHCELGRALTAQYGALISRVVYVKQAKRKQFAILDAGFTDLMRPSLYQAHHKALNLTSDGKAETYDLVGPICESTDVFGQDETLPATRRGDLIALLSAGAYGHVMASTYNSRPLVGEITSEDIVL